MIGGSVLFIFALGACIYFSWDNILVSKTKLFDIIHKTYNANFVGDDYVENDQLPQHAIPMSSILLGKISMPKSQEFEGLQNIEISGGETTLHGRKQKGKGTLPITRYYLMIQIESF